jgi:hypothetical protein
MILASVATLALSASSFLSFGNLIHLHVKPITDSRVDVTLVNSAPGFRDIKVDGQLYTINSGHTLTIKAPAGTVIYTESRMRTLRRGDVLLQLDKQMDHTSVSID